MNPYLVLGLTLEADDQTIRQAYLEAVKQSPPESDPERFKAVSQAYEQIKDETSRYRYELFNLDCPGDSPLHVLVQHLKLCRTKPLSIEAMKEYLRACSKS